MLGKAIAVGFLIGFGATFLSIAATHDGGDRGASAMIAPGSWEGAQEKHRLLLREDCPGAFGPRPGKLAETGRVRA